MRGKKKTEWFVELLDKTATHGQKGHHKTAHCSHFPVKVHIFWEGHKILRNLHCRFAVTT